MEVERVDLTNTFEGLFPLVDVLLGCRTHRRTPTRVLTELRF